MAPKSLCLTTAFAPVPTFLGRSCPLGCSLSAPATGGFSVVSPQYIRYAAGSEEEKRAGGPLPRDTIAHSFSFCKRGMGSPDGWSCCSQTLLQRRVWLGLRRYFARSALRRFLGTGGGRYLTYLGSRGRLGQGDAQQPFGRLHPSPRMARGNEKRPQQMRGLFLLVSAATIASQRRVHSYRRSVY